jgi:hypothetical protein
MGVKVGECKIRYKHFLVRQIHPKDVPPHPSLSEGERTNPVKLLCYLRR